jgi:hypothetical protein
MTQENSSNTGILNYIYEHKISLGLFTYGVISGTWFLYKKHMYLHDQRKEQDTIKALSTMITEYKNGNIQQIFDATTNQISEFTAEHQATVQTRINEATNTVATIDNILYYMPTAAIASTLLGIISNTDTLYTLSYILGYDADSY